MIIRSQNIDRRHNVTSQVKYHIADQKVLISSHLFFFIIQRVKASAILCPHQLPIRVITQFQ